MPTPRDNRRQLPWPTAHLCSDGVVRDLAEFIPGQWGCEDNRRDGEILWHAERSHIAHSLGRKALPEIEAMSRWN
jgi:hypothetical protein